MAKANKSSKKATQKKKKKKGFLVPFLFLLALFSPPLFKNKL
jgi:hypothetical protein